MRTFVLTLTLIFVQIFYANNAYSLTDSEITSICKKHRRVNWRINCIKNLKLKRFNLSEGKRIEIPVIPFKR